MQELGTEMWNLVHVAQEMLALIISAVAIKFACQDALSVYPLYTDLVYNMNAVNIN